MIVTALAMIAGWLWIADREPSTVRRKAAGVAQVVLPPLAPGPALNVVQRAAFEVRLSGTVRNASAAPIAAATVCAVCADCLIGPAGTRAPCVQTDASGVYVLAELELGNYRLTAGARGYEPALVYAGKVVRVGSAGLRADGLDATLEEGGALVTGFVVDGTGGPVAQAIVEAHFPPGSPARSYPVLQTTTCDDDGAFSIWVPRGGTRFIARADGYSPGDFFTDAPATNVRLVMTPESGISGHVVTLEGGRPVANVRVNAERRGVEQYATSDDQGAFHIAGLSPGTFNLTASGKGWLGRMSGSVTIDIGEQATGVLVYVYPGVAVRGVVQIGDQPCTGGKAVLVPAPGQALTRLDARTDLQGRVAFEAVPPGRYQSGAICDDFGSVQGAEVKVGDADIDSLVWRFDPGSTVMVAARTAGMPAEHTWIELQDALAPIEPDVPQPETRHAGWTDAKGEIRFYGVQAANYRVQGSDLTQPIPVTVRPGDNRFEVAIDALGYLDVTVTTTNGAPNDDVGVFAATKGRAPGQGLRFDSGRYRVGPLAQGAYDVYVRDGANPGTQAQAEVRAGTTTALALTYGGYEGAITGRVVDDARAPVANVWVTAEPEDDGRSWTAQGLAHDIRVHHRRVATDSDGRFEVPGLEARGKFNVVVTRRLGGEQKVSGVAVGQNIEVVLASTSTLAGRVVDQDGEPVAHFRLSLDNAATRQALSPLFGPEAAGRFRVEDVTAGQVTLTASLGDGEQASKTVEVGENQALTGIELRIAPMQAQGTDIPSNHSQY